MNKSKVVNSLSLFFLLFIAAGSYLTFVKYKPKLLASFREVRGYKTTRSVDLPYPEDSTGVGITQTADTKQITFKTSKSAEYIHDFYKTILQTEEWEITTDGTSGTSLLSKYEKGDSTITIIISETKESTFVGIDIDKRK